MVEELAASLWQRRSVSLEKKRHLYSIRTTTYIHELTQMGRYIRLTETIVKYQKGVFCPPLNEDPVLRQYPLHRLIAYRLMQMVTEKLKELNEDLQVVFTTAYPGYASEAFRVSALDYLLKPVTPEALERVVDRLLRHRVFIQLQGDRFH
jgi:hypothetical protein